jgi:hypothetical protein
MARITGETRIDNPQSGNRNWIALGIGYGFERDRVWGFIADLLVETDQSCQTVKKTSKAACFRAVETMRTWFATAVRSSGPGLDERERKTVGSMQPGGAG